jgi:hypothetical protein
MLQHVNLEDSTFSFQYWDHDGNMLRPYPLGSTDAIFSSPDIVCNRNQVRVRVRVPSTLNPPSSTLRPKSQIRNSKRRAHVQEAMTTRGCSVNKIINAQDSALTRYEGNRLKFVVGEVRAKRPRAVMSLCVCFCHAHAWHYNSRAQSASV